MNPILRALTDAELEARLNADPATPGALEELLVRFKRYAGVEELLETYMCDDVEELREWIRELSGGEQ